MTDDTEMVEAPPKRGPGRPPKPRAPHPPLPAPKSQRHAAALERVIARGNGADEPDPQPWDWANGVTANFLAKLFGLEVSTVRNRLSDCPTVGKKTSGALYRVVDAAPFLVKPRFDVEQTLKRMKPQDLPEQLREGYWSAQLKRQKWEREAGHLWRSEDVMAGYAEVFKRIKFHCQLWADTVQTQHGLTQPQRETLTRLVDVLQDEIYEGIVDMTKERATESTARELVQFDENIAEDDLSDVL